MDPMEQSGGIWAGVSGDGGLPQIRRSSSYLTLSHTLAAAPLSQRPSTASRERGGGGGMGGDASRDVRTAPQLPGRPTTSELRTLRPMSALKQPGSSRHLAVSFNAHLEETELLSLDGSRREMLRVPAVDSSSRGASPMRFSSFFNPKQFSLDDYFRSQDAKLGIVEVYNATPHKETWGADHTDSPTARSTHSSHSSMGSRLHSTLSPNPSRPGSAGNSGRPGGHGLSAGADAGEVVVSRMMSAASQRSQHSQHSQVSGSRSRTSEGRNKTPAAQATFLQNKTPAAQATFLQVVALASLGVQATFLQAKQKQAERQAKEVARKKEQQDKLLEAKRMELQRYLIDVQLFEAKHMELQRYLIDVQTFVAMCEQDLAAIRCAI
ncbi:hypothetical protein T484DRAFT_1897361 [Baffinella frigidus]|nr:hypothetical protein T484DRAFT_1897361 [Cryptophyta sp. CCMP2293]